MGVFSRGARKKHRRRTPRFLTTSAPAPCPPSCDNRPVTHIRHALALAAAFALALPSAAQTITTIAGIRKNIFTGDGPASETALARPGGLTFDRDGRLVIADTQNHAIRRLDAKTGILTTIAGDGTPGFEGDGGPAAKARLNFPIGLGLDGKGNLYVVDSINARIRKIEGVAAR